ncbi:hypothetical protein ACNKHV_01180 [Shigella flexneri]
MLDGMGREAMVASDAALLASGTAARSVCWGNAQWWWVSHEAFHLLVAKRLVKTDYVSLPNLLAAES